MKKYPSSSSLYPDNSFDIVLSFNALDHSVDPAKVIREINRVLCEGGDFLLWIYVLRDGYKFLQSLLNLLDPPHPFHFTVKKSHRKCHDEYVMVVVREKIA